MLIINNDFRVFTIATIGIIFSLSLHAQANSDSAILQFLRTKPDIPPPFLKIEREGKEIVRSQNFFSVPNKPIKDDSLTIRTFLFGSSASHASKYFLIEVISPKQVIYKIFDEQTLEVGLASVFSFLRAYSISESKKAQIVNYFSFTYY
jgi:hypothetical protein